jgi:hypothetical protein
MQLYRRPICDDVIAVSIASNQNLLVTYLREFSDENGKAVCTLSKAMLKVFGIISNGMSVNDVLYSDSTQFLSLLCTFSRYLLLSIPDKVQRDLFVRIRPIGVHREIWLLGMEMSAQCKLIDMTNFSPKACRSFPSLRSCRYA